MLTALFDILDFLLGILGWIIIGQVILSWLFAFNVLNTSSPGLRRFVERWSPDRAALPADPQSDADFGGSILAVVVLILIQVLRMLLNGAERSLVTSTI